MERVIPNARMRAKAEVRAEIIAEARRQLALEGAPSLSLRAVTRALGMASSAAYRYFPSRDELLTALIVEAFNELGEAAEAATAGRGRAFRQWQLACRAIRGWALAQPHQYMLVYGSPVPGYQAPELTIGPASRVTLVLVGIIVDAARAGELDVAETPPLPRAMAAEARRISQLAMPGVPLHAVANALLARTQIFGQISFELFGQLEGVVEDPEVLFEYAVVTMGRLVGLRPA